ncbi:MAG: hypothetical protein JO084_05175 [Bradyrhizobiaceae bacterium]|nr:hypothetical protein [Bradyrhizobiaceae bacterium]
MAEDEFRSAHASAHAAMHDSLVKALAHSHPEIDAVHQLEGELRLRKALLKIALNDELTQRAAALKLRTPQDVSHIVDSLFG